MEKSVEEIIDENLEELFLDDASVESDHRSEEIRSKLKEVFATFDEDGDDYVDAADVGHVLRCMGFSPTLHDLDILLGQLVKHENKVAFETLAPRVVVATEKALWKRETESEIQAAFETLTDGHPKINKSTLIQMLSTKGEPLTPQEIKEMLNHLTIRKNGEVDWPAYIKDVLEHVKEG